MRKFTKSAIQLLVLFAVALCFTYIGYLYGYSNGNKEGLTHADAVLIKDNKDASRIEMARISVPVLKAIVARPDAFEPNAIVFWKTVSKSSANSIESLILPSLKKSDPDNYSKLIGTIAEIRSTVSRIPAIN